MQNTENVSCIFNVLAYRYVDDSKDFIVYDAPVVTFIGVTNSYLPLYQHAILIAIGKKNVRMRNCIFI